MILATKEMRLPCQPRGISRVEDWSARTHGVCSGGLNTPLEIAYMKKLLAILVAGMFASGAFAQAAPNTAPEAAPAAAAAPHAKAAKNHHAKATPKHKHVKAKKARKHHKAAA